MLLEAYDIKSVMWVHGVLMKRKLFKLTDIQTGWTDRQTGTHKGQQAGEGDGRVRPTCREG